MICIGKLAWRALAGANTLRKNPRLGNDCAGDAASQVPDKFRGRHDVVAFRERAQEPLEPETRSTARIGATSKNVPGGKDKDVAIS